MFLLNDAMFECYLGPFAHLKVSLTNIHVVCTLSAWGSRPNDSIYTRRALLEREEGQEEDRLVAEVAESQVLMPLRYFAMFLTTF